GRIPMPPPRPAPTEAPKAPSRGPLAIAGVIGGVIVILLLGVLFSGSKERPQTVHVEPAPNPTPQPTPQPHPTNTVARDLEELDARLALPMRQEKLQEASAIVTAARGKH